MRKALALLGLVLVPLGFGATALAQSGSDSSGRHSYNLECSGEDLIFSNTGEGRLQILVSLAGGQPLYTVGAGQSVNFGTPGEDTGPPGTYFEVYFEDPAGSGNFVGLDSGSFPDCVDTPPEPENPTYSATAEIVCEGPQIQVNNTGTGHFLVWEEMTLTYQQVFAGQSGLIPWNTDTNGDLVDPMYWVARPPGVGAGTAGGGQFTLADLEAACAEAPPTTQPNVPDVAPELISECRGADWYLVHPDNSPALTYAYRMSTGDILYDADYTSNNPAAVYGEVLIPAGTDEVGYADDFNATHTVTRPAECGGPTHNGSSDHCCADHSGRADPQHSGARCDRGQRLRCSRCRDRSRRGDVRCDRLRFRRGSRGHVVLDAACVGNGDG